MAGESARFRRDAFLQTTVARRGKSRADRKMRCSAVLKRAAAIFAAMATPVALPTPWPNGPVVHSTPGVSKNSGCPGVLLCKLPETLDLRHRQIVTAQVEPGVKEHAAVTGGENEVIAIDPARLVGIMAQSVAVKDCAHFRAA